jgi:HEAT repeat protein
MLFTSIILFVLISPVDAAAAADAEPTHHGRQLSAWLADLGGDDKARHEAMLAVAKIGPPARAALPGLISQLKAPQPKEGKFPLDIDAAQALEAIGPAAKGAVPVLLARMKQPRTPGYCLAAADAVLALEGPRVEATWGLVAEFNPTCGGASLFVSRSAKSYPAETVRHLIELTRDENPLIRESALDILGLPTRQLPAVAVQPADLFRAAGAATKGVPAAVEQALADKDPHVRVAASRAHLALSPDRAEAVIPAVVAALNEGWFRFKKGSWPGEEPAGLLRPVAAKAFEPLLPLLEHKTPYLREEAVWTLARLPVQAQLEKALKEEKSAVRRAGVAAALGHGDFPTAPPALTAALQDADADVRFRAAAALVERTRGGPGAAAAVPGLVEGLRETDPGALDLALRSLRALKTVGAPATGRLKELTRHAKLDTRVEVALTLAAVNPREPAALPPLVEALGPDYRYYRGDVYEALGNLGPVATPALPELEKHLDGSHYTVNVARAIFRIDPDGPGEKRAIIALTNMADRYEEPVRVLQELPNKGKAAVPFLLERLSDPKTANAGAAVAILALDPASGEPALRWLRQKLTTGEEKDVSAILAQLWQLGEGGRALLPELVGLLKSRSEEIRDAAVDVLHVIGPAARDALPALRELAASDPSPKVRGSAAAAVRQVGAK